MFDLPRFARVSGWLALLTLTACARTVVTLPTPAGALVTSTPERSAIVREAAGQVEVRPDASATWGETSAGLVLSVGSQFRTAPDSRAMIQLTEGSKLRLGAETTLTFNILNPFMDSLLTSVALDHGALWVLLTAGSALDVETPIGLASARASYMSVAYDPATQTAALTCLQGICSFEKTFIPAGYKYTQTGLAAALPEPMTLTDYGHWGVSVPEATELVALATEAVAQGSATLPVAPGTPTLEPASPTPVPSDTETAVPAPTAEPAQTAAAAPSATPAPTAAAIPTAAPTQAPATPTAVPPRPTVPSLGQHTVQPGETIFCLARAYGVLPDAIVQANGLSAPYTVTAGQSLRIPAVRWEQILPGPVCAPQFQSPYPGLPFVTETPTATAPPLETPTPAPALEIREVAALCVGNCTDSAQPTYRLLIIITAAGGAEPLAYEPGQSFELDFPRCTQASGTVTVRSLDGQVATGRWVYDDVACPPAP